MAWALICVGTYLLLSDLQLRQELAQVDLSNGEFPVINITSCDLAVRLFVSMEL